MTPREFVLEHTVVAAPPLCPELSLRLITEACPLWRAGEDAAAAAGIPEPFWAFCWAGGQALARYVLDHPEAIAAADGRPPRVLDFGSGGAIEGIAAAREGARVVAADIEPMAAAAAALNAELNGVALECRSDDPVGTDDGWDVVLAGDVFYDAPLAERFVQWLGALAERGATVLIGDPDRGYVPRDRLETLACYPAPADNDRPGQLTAKATVYRLLGSTRRDVVG